MGMNAKSNEILKRIKANVLEIDASAEVILYGSRARGDARKDSDWDILILTDNAVSLAKESEFRDHLFDLELEVEEPFSVFAYSKMEWNTKQSVTPFFENVLEEGVAI